MVLVSVFFRFFVLSLFQLRLCSFKVRLFPRVWNVQSRRKYCKTAYSLSMGKIRDSCAKRVFRLSLLFSVWPLPNTSRRVTEYDGEAGREFASRRHRERSLRSWLRHEWQSVAMALAGFKH